MQLFAVIVMVAVTALGWLVAWSSQAAPNRGSAIPDAVKKPSGVEPRV